MLAVNKVVACRALTRAAAETAVVVQQAVAVRPARKILRAAAHPAAALQAKVSSKDPAAAVAHPADQPVAAVQRVVRLAAVPQAQPARWAAAQPEACKVAVQRVVLERMPAACKVEAVRRVVDPLAALRVAVECRAVVLRAAMVPQVEPAQWVAAALQAAAEVFRRPGAEPAVAVPKALKAVVLKVRKVAAMPAVVAAAVR
ncbi:hypothetical protein [Steroidobacter cummioxidans]|uniref:hypothetical protein n=1 Tax=Steroidobacter cummioxidans TaxID=1803913 RepID=UPI001379BCBC|nr:hypothetical protein [Steroidobacter cummioxidans]